MTKQSDIIDIIMTESSLLLSSSLIEKLKVNPGDRISIGYIEKEGILTPIIHKDSGGNKLNKTGSISFRGKQRELLTQFGSLFWITECNDDFCELKGNGIPIYTKIKKAVEAYISKEIILDTNYNIDKITNYEF